MSEVGPWFAPEMGVPDVMMPDPLETTVAAPEARPQHFTREGADEYEAYTVALVPGSSAIILCGDDMLRSSVGILLTTNVGPITVGHRSTVASGNGFNLAPNVMLNMTTVREVCATAPQTNTGVALVSVLTERNRG